MRKALVMEKPRGGEGGVCGEIEITINPSVDQYERLCRDLEALRSAGAPSNTAAICDAVRRAAELSPTLYDRAITKRPGSADTPRGRSQGDEVRGPRAP